MKIASSKVYDYENWRPCFAWLPVETDDGWRWLEMVERRNVASDEFSGECHEYRLVRPGGPKDAQISETISAVWPDSEEAK